MAIDPIKPNTRFRRGQLLDANKTSPGDITDGKPRAYSTRSYLHQFDFEVGYLVKSPCRSCHIRELFPECLDSCDTLDEVHSLLADCVSCTRRR